MSDTFTSTLNEKPVELSCETPSSTSSDDALNHGEEKSLTSTNSNNVVGAGLDNSVGCTFDAFSNFVLSEIPAGIVPDKIDCNNTRRNPKMWMEEPEVSGWVTRETMIDEMNRFRPKPIESLEGRDKTVKISHHSHPLNLYSYGVPCFKCNICCNTIEGTAYRCEESTCDFDCCFSCCDRE